MKKQILVRWLGFAGLLAAVVFGLTQCAPAPAAQPALGNDVVTSIDALAQPGVFNHPLDAAPDPDGTMVYFTATGANGKGIFRVPAAGGTAVEVVTGAPFVDPRGIAVSTNGQFVYVADAQAVNGNGKVGAVFAVPVNGSAPLALPGTEGMAPLNLTVAKEGNADVIYFTGKDSTDGQPAVFKTATSGNNATSVVVKGAPFVTPDGIAVAKNGTLYLTDTSAAGNGLGSVFRVMGTTVTKIADKVRLGSPAGTALTLNDSLLLVSAMDATSGNDQVLLINPVSLQTGLVTKVVEANHESSGGLHAAYNQPLLAWADVIGSPYRVRYPAVTNGK